MMRQHHACPIRQTKALYKARAPTIARTRAVIPSSERTPELLETVADGPEEVVLAALVDSAVVVVASVVEVEKAVEVCFVTVALVYTPVVLEA